jgi:hypothetical protein
MSKIKILIDNFINKIISSKTINLEEKNNFIDKLLKNIIDYCIKRNIYFFINNKIKYTTICNLFKENIICFIKNIISTNNNDILDYIDNNIENFDNFSDINSLLFNKYKKNDLEDEDKNLEDKDLADDEIVMYNSKVSFRDNISLVTENDNNSNNIKYNVTHMKLNDDTNDNININNNINNNDNINNRSKNINKEITYVLYIQILLSQTDFEKQEFINELNNICKKLCNCKNKDDFSNIFTS